ncbi:hypothetical protein I4U23_016650 [Adineta vaga]|nr:hypothetical protein I4U23_016650 [Adineta vaga]
MLTKEDVQTPMELSVITFSSEEPNVRHRAVTKYADNSYKIITSTLDNEYTSSQRKLISENVEVQTELTASALIDEEWTFRPLIKGKDIGVQIKMAETMFSTGQINDLQSAADKNIEITNTSSHMHGDEVLNQAQMLMMTEYLSEVTNTSMITNQRLVEVTAEQPRLTIIQVSNGIERDLGPVIGYADEPLLPLSKACSPLNSILHNLSFYGQMAIDETSELPPDGLTIDESAAIRLYTMEWKTSHRSLYSMLNYTLKNKDREHLRPYFKYLKLFLTALVKLPCVPPSTVWRGVTKNVSAEFPPGKLVTWWAFSSCTTELTVLDNETYLGSTGNRTLFSVEAINGRSVQEHSHFVTEDEILLLSGIRMVVLSQFSPAPDLHVIHLKQIVPTEMLLQPPFEGARLYPKLE